MKLPAFLHYPGDWRKDPGVQALTYHDRGVWWEMINIMHETEPRGKLMLNGKPMPNDVLARLLGLTLELTQATVSTLLDFGVASRDEQGVIFCRRMVRDEGLRKIRSEAGKLGAPFGKLGGRPNKRQKTAKQTAKEPLGQRQTEGQNNPPSSSSSSSITSSTPNTNTLAGPNGAGEVVTPKADRPRNEIWDALVDVTDSQPQTKSEESNWGKCCRELKEAGATADEIHKRANNYRRKYSGVALTVNAMVNHWGDCAKAVIKKAPADAEEDPNERVRKNIANLERIMREGSAT